MKQKEANKMTIDNITVQSLHDALNDGGYICSPLFSAQLTTAIKTKPVGGAFLHGMAGTGKSYLPHVLSDALFTLTNVQTEHNLKTCCLNLCLTRIQSRV